MRIAPEVQLIALCALLTAVSSGTAMPLSRDQPPLPTASAHLDEPPAARPTLRVDSDQELPANPGPAMDGSFGLFDPDVFAAHGMGVSAQHLSAHPASSLGSRPSPRPSTGAIKFANTTDKTMGCNGQQPSGMLQVSITNLNSQTGRVDFDGSDARSPRTPFTWSWGDANTTSGFFPQSHTYRSTTQNYTVQLTSHENDGSTDCVELLVTFVAASEFALDWIPVGPQSIPPDPGSAYYAELSSGKLQAFAAYGPNPSIAYAGGGVGSGNEGPLSEAGAFRTTNGGQTWSPIDTGLIDHSVDALWADQANADHALVGTWGTGIFQTLDGGASWTLVAGFGATTGFAQRGAAILAGTAQGIARSDDGGSTWRVTQKTSNPVLALATGAGGAIAGLQNGDVVFSPSPNASWTTVLSNPGRQVWAVAIGQDSVLNLAVIATQTGPPFSIQTSSDGGASWSSRTLPNGHGQPQALATDPMVPGLLYVGVNGALYATRDLGSTWTQIPNAGWDIRSVFPDASSPTAIVVGSDQGLFETRDAGSTWQSLAGSLSNSLIMAIAVSGNTIAAAVQDFNPIISFNAGSSWTHLAGNAPPMGEDGTVLINSGDPRYCYAYTTAGYQYSTDGCHSFTGVPALGFLSYEQPGGTEIVAVDAMHPMTVYAAAQAGVYKSTDGGITLSLTAWPLTHATALAVDPNDSSTIFVGTTTGLWVTQDGGSTWTQAALPGAGYPATIAVDPAHSQVVLVGLSQGPWASGGIVRSANGGRSFVAANTGLANAVPPYGMGYDVRSIGFDPSSAAPFVAAALSNGIYLSTDAGATWHPASANAIPRFFTGIAWNAGYLYASTLGEGILRSQGPLGSCSSASTLCIDDQPGDRRWQVTASFATAQGGGRSGSGQPIPLASLKVSRGGLFWFFDSTNPEMLLKVLNACSLNQQFWVFYSATTNAGFTVTVVDTHNGRSKLYSNQDGAAALPIEDTSAFACTAGDAGPAGRAGVTKALGQPPDEGAVEAAPPPGAVPLLAPIAKAGCSTTTTSLCIGGRFQIQVDYHTAQGGGSAGSGQAIGLESLGVAQGGLFWFFAADNPEMLVKVLDACSLNDKFWIFYAAGTNVAFSLTVIDMQTGQMRTYHNSDGTAAPPVQDTSALPCE